MLVLARDFSSWPDTPKSQSLIWPFLLTRTFVGFTSCGNVIFSVSEMFGVNEKEKRITSMYNLQIVLQEFQSPGHTSRDPRQHVLRYTRPLKFIQAASIHVLHTIIHAALDEERPVELDDLRVDSPMQDIKL